MHPIYSELVHYIKSQFPHVESNVLDKLTPNIVSPFKIKLPQRVLVQAQAIVKELHALTQSPSYIAQLKKDFPYTDFQKTPSLLNSLDVHLMPGGQLKIIEINTNASSYLINVANYASRQISTFPKAKAKLLESFRRSFAYHLEKNAFIAIIDEAPQNQNLYVEFLMFKELLERELNVTCQIVDVKDLTVDQNGCLFLGEQPVAAVYNRFTDFYFSESPALKAAYGKNASAISPNPWGYSTLADKTRMLTWTDGFFNQLESTEKLKCPELRKALLKIKKFSDFSDHETLWAERGNYFFKPPNSFGGKSVYKGKSISRTMFQKIYTGDYLAQELAPPPELELVHEGIEYDFKYDLRFYFFEDEIHMGIARLYQGQLTNLQTAFGGLTPLEFVE